MDEATNHDFNQLANKIQTNRAVVGVIGLGYVGLPLVVETVNKGYSTIGFDINLEKIAQLNKGESYIADLSPRLIQEALVSGRFTATSKFELLKNVDVIIICVPTPINKDKSPNISYIEKSMEQINQYMKSGVLIILESTTYPGTTRKIIDSSIDKKRYTTGKNCFIAYSPERIDPGNHQFNVKNTPKVVGGLTENCAKLAKLFYEHTIQVEVHVVSTPEVAEMEKLLENTFRQVNIAFINELSKVCHTMNIDIWEVIDAAATKPYGFMRFTPGPGVGGHCIPVDPQYLLWAGKQHNMDMSLIDAANKVNDMMPHFIIERLKGYLKLDQKQLMNAKVLIIGAAYKPNINDVRESPALKIILQLQREKCDVQIVDPFIEEVCNIQTVPLTSELVSQADGVLILTNHSNVDYEIIDKNARFIFDTRQTNFKFMNQDYYKL